MKTGEPDSGAHQSNHSRCDEDVSDAEVMRCHRRQEPADAASEAVVEDDD